MPTGPLGRTLVVAEATIYGTLQSKGAIGLALAAILYPLLVGAIGAESFPGLDLLGASEVLFSTLFLPIILLLVCLVQGVALFRTELEEDTLLYPLKRTIPRPALVAGKYLGFLVTTLLALLPSAIFGIGLATLLGKGPTVATSGLYEAVAVMTVLGVVGYGATFLVLGLITRYALIIGLIYGFLWEAFVSLLTGPISQWTVVYYLRDVGNQLVPSGSLGGSSSSASVAGVSLGFFVFAVACLALTSAILRYTEIRPAAAPT